MGVGRLVNMVVEEDQRRMNGSLNLGDNNRATGDLAGLKYSLGEGCGWTR